MIGIAAYSGFLPATWQFIVDNKMINELTVSKYNKQGSGIISSIAFSDGIIEIPEDYSELKSGDVFRFYSKDALF